MKYMIDTYETILKNWKDVKPGCTVLEDNDPIRVEEFETIEEAKVALRKIPSTVQRAAGGGYLVTESWLWEDDGICASSLDCSEMPRLVLNRDGHIIDFAAAEALMVEEIRAGLSGTDQEIFDAYCESYEDAHGEPWGVWWEV